MQIRVTCSEFSCVMAGKDYSLNDSPRIQDAFTKCIKDLVEKSDFDVMYEELNNTPISKNECRVSLY